MDSFKGQTAIVTGGATGIGAAAAASLAAQGVHVCILDLDTAGAEAVARDIAGSGGTAIARRADLTDWAGTRAAVDAFAQDAGRLDIVVHSAGGFPAYVSLIDCPVEAWDPVVNSNLRSMFYLLKAAA